MNGSAEIYESIHVPFGGVLIRAEKYSHLKRGVRKFDSDGEPNYWNYFMQPKYDDLLQYVHFPVVLPLRLIDRFRIVCYRSGTHPDIDIETCLREDSRLPSEFTRPWLPMRDYEGRIAEHEIGPTATWRYLAGSWGGGEDKSEYMTKFAIQRPVWRRFITSCFNAK